MKTTNNNNGTNAANNNGTNNLQTINLEENVKFSEIPAIYNFGKFSIFVEKKQTGKTHGEKTLYFGTITNNETTETTEMAGFDITKIKKIVGCTYTRVYISNTDGVTIPKTKEMSDEMITSMVQSMQITTNKAFANVYTKLEKFATADDLQQLNDIFDSILLRTLQSYEKTLKDEQLRLSIENKEREQKRQAKQATKDAKNIDTTTEEGVIQAQIIQAMMAGDFATLAELTNKLQTLQSK